MRPKIITCREKSEFLGEISVLYSSPVVNKSRPLSSGCRMESAENEVLETSEQEDAVRPSPRLLATAKPTESRLKRVLQSQRDSVHEPNLFRSAQWSADGTTVITTLWDHTLAAHVLPGDLLDTSSGIRSIEATSSSRHPEPIRAVAVNPAFSLTEPTSQTAILTSVDRPVQLHHLFPHEDGSSRIASYLIINTSTEQYIAPVSIAWTGSSPQHAICGSANRLDVLDVTREGTAGHVTMIPTAKKTMAAGNLGLVQSWRGMVSALAVQPPDSSGQGSSLVAAGSWARWVALYDYMRCPSLVSGWALPQSGSSGRGVVQVIWSPCGRYLVVNERFGHGLLLYDIRGAARELALLPRVQSQHHLMLSCDVFASSIESSERGGFEIWASSDDGRVRVWENAGSREGEIECTWAWRAHESTVISTALHPTGSVVLTSAGNWDPPEDQALETTPGKAQTTKSWQASKDTSLRIWSMF